MATDAERIANIKSQTLGLIEQITTDPRPNYTRDGRTYSWGDYLQSLQETVAWCDQQLAAVQPFEVVSRGCA